ncbi:quinate 5-dehydrogenase [bacterium]|nr:quinate 5-dehydrogenase [bacterium]
MLKVVSVSLGSSSRDKTTRTTFLEQEVELSRVGMDGDLERARKFIGELDGQVDAIGLGGIDRYLCAGNRKYEIRDARRLAAAATKTPVVDGSDLKLLLERRLVHELAADFTANKLAEARVLQVSAVDRWGMAEALAEHAREIIFGDLMFGLGIPITVRGIKAIKNLARILAPIVVRLPFQILYPTGSKQKEHKPRFSEYFVWADWICGDFHYIRRNLPERLDGKVILTNTTTSEDQQLLKQRGLGYLITTTPVIDGRSFGMNVLEGCLVAMIVQQGDHVTSEMIEIYLNKLNLHPTITELN